MSLATIPYSPSGVPGTEEGLLESCRGSWLLGRGPWGEGWGQGLCRGRVLAVDPPLDRSTIFWSIHSTFPEPLLCPCSWNRVSLSAQARDTHPAQTLLGAPQCGLGGEAQTTPGRQRGRASPWGFPTLASGSAARPMVRKVTVVTTITREVRWEPSGRRFHGPQGPREHPSWASKQEVSGPRQRVPRSKGGELGKAVGGAECLGQKDGQRKGWSG